MYTSAVRKDWVPKNQLSCPYQLKSTQPVAVSTTSPAAGQRRGNSSSTRPCTASSSP